MNGNQGISGVDTAGAAIGALVAGLLVAIVVAVVYAAKWAFYPALRSLRESWQRPRGAVVSRVARPMVQQASKLVQPAPAPAPAGVATDTGCEVAERIKTVILRSGAAALHLRIFADEVRPRVVMRNARLVARHGKRVDLAPVALAGTTAEAVEGGIVAQAEALVTVRRCARKAKEVAVSAGESQVAPEENLAEFEYSQQQAEFEYAQMPAEFERDLEPDPQPEAPIARAKPASARIRPPRKGLVSYSGVLLRAGVERRDDVKEPYDCYCVTIADAALGEELQLWGTDLGRAINEAGVAAGDPVRISLVGETPVFYRGKSSVKKIWAVEHQTANSGKGE